MAYPRVKQFCCGCTLETGSMIISWIGIICSILGILSFIIQLASGNAQGQTAYISIYLINTLINLALSVLLLMGIRRKLPSYVNLWVICTTVMCILSSILIAISSIMIMVNGAIGAGIGSLIGGLIGIMIVLYFLIVVSSYRKELAGDNRGV